MGNLATLAHLVYCQAGFPLFQIFLTSIIRCTVLLFIYLFFIIFGEKLSVQWFLIWAGHDIRKLATPDLDLITSNHCQAIMFASIFINRICSKLYIQQQFTFISTNKEPPRAKFNTSNCSNIRKILVEFHNFWICFEQAFLSDFSRRDMQDSHKLWSIAQTSWQIKIR